MPKGKAFEVCPFNHGDCFARLVDGCCYCLDDTHFPKGKQTCPFYKTKAVSPVIVQEVRDTNHRIVKACQFRFAV